MGFDRVPKRHHKKRKRIEQHQPQQENQRHKRRPQRFQRGHPQQFKHGGFAAKKRDPEERRDRVGRRQLHRDVLRLARGPRQHLRREDHQVLRQLRGVGGEAGPRPGQDPGGDHERMPVSHFDRGQ